MKSPILLNIENILAKVMVKILRLSVGRMGNWPYLSQSNFRKLADFEIIDRIHLDSTQKIRQSKVLFVATHLLDDVLDKCFEIINANILITGDSDANITEDRILPPSVKIWLAQNSILPPSFRNYVIPIGLEDASYGRLGLKFHYRIRRKKKLNKVFIPPMSPTNPIRNLVQNLKTTPEIEIESEYLNAFRYVHKIRKYRFTLCLEGNGFENHRIWETLYFNSFPVMLRTPFSENLLGLGLPILIIDSLDSVNATLLSAHFLKNEAFDSREYEVLWMDYWKMLITKNLFEN